MQNRDSGSEWCGRLLKANVCEWMQADCVELPHLSDGCRVVFTHR